MVLIFPFTFISYIENEESDKRVWRKFGKDPTVETSFLPDRLGIPTICFPQNKSFLLLFYLSCSLLAFLLCNLEFKVHLFSEREAEEQAERERLRKQWLREQELIKSKHIILV